MPFELQIHFCGLAGLVPMVEAGSGDEPEEWLVAMPSLERGLSLSKEHPGGGVWQQQIAPHQALLVTDPRFVVDPQGAHAKRPFLTIRPGSGHPGGGAGDRSIYRFDHEYVEISAGAAGIEIRLELPVKESPSPGEEQDLLWVPSLDDVKGEPVAFDYETCLEPDRRTKEPLSGAVRLDRGRLYTRDVLRNVANQPIVYEFRSLDSQQPPHRQSIAEAYVLALEVPEPSASLIFRDRQGDRRGIELSADAVDDPDTNEAGQPIVRVDVMNRELEEVLGFESQPLQNNVYDWDFYVFYWLSTRWQDWGIADLPIPFNPNGTGGGAKPCEPPRFSGNP